MLEHTTHNGEYFITFDVIELNEDNHSITIATSCAGKISVQEFDLYEDENGLYFEYGPLLDIIRIDDFLIR